MTRVASSRTRTALAALAVALPFAVACCSSYGTASSPDADAGQNVQSDGASNADGGGATDSGEAGACGPKPSSCAGALVRPFDFAGADFPPAGLRVATDNNAIVERGTEGACGLGSLRATATVPATGAPHGIIFRSETGTFSKIHVAYTFRGPKPLGGGYVNPGCAISFYASASAKERSTVYLELDNTTLAFTANTSDSSGAKTPIPNPIVLDDFVTDARAQTWRTIDVQFTLGTASVTAALTFDDTPFPPISVPLVAPAGYYNFDCGISYAESSGTTYTVDIDDLLIELCP